MSLTNFYFLEPWLNASIGGQIGYSAQNISSKIRFPIGIAYVFISLKLHENIGSPGIKAVLPSIINDENKTYWPEQIILSTLQMNAVFGSSVFGGKKFFYKRGITNRKQTFIACLSNGLAYFKENEYKNNRYMALNKIAKYIGLFGVGRIISHILKRNDGYWIKKLENNEINIIVQLELLAFFKCLQQCFQNVWPLVLNVIVCASNNESVIIKEPNHFVYFYSSFRDFWKSWSIPVGEYLRYLVYEPLGGRKNLGLSVGALFMFNNLQHWSSTKGIYGNSAAKEWTQAFIILGLCVGAEIQMEKRIENFKEKKRNDWRYKIAGLIWFHGGFLTVVNILRKNAWHNDWHKMCDSFLIGQEYLGF